MISLQTLSLAALLFLLDDETSSGVDAFAPLHPRAPRTTRSVSRWMSDDKTSSEETAVFVPLDEAPKAEETSADDEKDDDVFEKVESMGRGAAKKKRGRRKGSSAAAAKRAAPKKALAPEEVFYEGPPAVTETIAPTLSILTVIGVIPAAAAWARQAWVRYKITTRRIRVNSGVNGKDMAEIVYPDIVEIRTARRLFGDGDLVAFLKDGAKFEMRNIPNFEETMEFVLKQVDPKVAAEYRESGEVTQNK